MDRRVAQGRPAEPQAERADSGRSADAIALSVAVGLGLVLVALFVYTSSRPLRFYDHFEWQAAAFLEGEVAIRYPVESTPDSAGNAFFQDVLPIASDDGPRGLIPFPPLPAILLVPFVAAWGHAADGPAIFAVLGAIDVGLAWWVLGGLAVRPWVRLAATVFFAFGTVFWYTAQIGTTWYQAHVLAVGLALLAVGIALRADPAAGRDDEGAAAGDGQGGDAPGDGGVLGVVRHLARHGLDRRQLLAGLVFGLACTSRLPIAFAAPFFVLVGGGGTWLRRGASAGIGAAIPIGGLILYNVIATGHVLHPAYEYLYQLEASFYTSLGYNLDWAVEDPRYIPQNAWIMLFSTPAILPDVYPAGLGGGEALCTEPGAVRELFERSCPIALPRDIGMSIFMTSPAYVLAAPALVRLWGRSRVVTGAALAVLLVAIFNLMHFSQGWVQFGYRFSNDFVPWALLLVALGMERIRSGRGIALAVPLIVVSILVNAWGVAWGGILGW